MKHILLALLLATSVVFADDDPFEGFNRSVFNFNQAIDEAIFEPVAKSYKENIPKTAQTAVSNFVGNLTDVSTLVNQLLQFKPIASIKTLGRVTINTTAGIAGLFDVATEVGIDKTNEDFGQTMGVWGVPEGAFVMLPIFGPSTIRDSFGKVADGASFNYATKDFSDVAQNTSIALDAVDVRVRLLPLTDYLKHADDPYIVARSSYLQKRKNDVFDGKPPVVEEDEF